MTSKKNVENYPFWIGTEGKTKLKQKIYQIKNLSSFRDSGVAKKTMNSQNR